MLKVVKNQLPKSDASVAREWREGMEFAREWREGKAAGTQSFPGNEETLSALPAHPVP